MTIRTSFTDKQLEILGILKDGERHSIEEIMEKANVGSRKTLSNYINQMRRVLVLFGETIVCELSQRKSHYRHVKLIGKNRI